MQNYNFDLDLESKNTISVMLSWIRSHTNVLEFGPANGRMTRYLKLEKQCRVTIVEIDREAGSEAAQYAQIAYIGMPEGDIESFYWKNADKKYDYIVFADVLEHLSDPSRALNECRQVLKEDGEILISIPNIAHNSILVSLFQDEFAYGETGLLDKTHIHFFTYHSFLQMIDILRYRIVKQDVIYSRVGWNEIKAGYADVPYSVERELKNRRSGSIYQYIFSLKQGEEEHSCHFFDIENLEKGEAEEKEAGCYLLSDESTHFIKRISNKYALRFENKLCFEIHKKVQKVRLDLLEENMLICLDKIAYKCDGEEEMVAELIEHNAQYVINRIYFFTTNDPWIIVKLNTKQLAVEYVKAEFCVLDVRMGEAAKKCYSWLFKNILSFLEGDRFAGSYVQKYLFWDVSEKYEKELDDARQYQRHLEQDIALLQKELEDAQNNAALQKALEDAQDNIALRKALEDAKAYQSHLENDIKKLQRESMRIREESEAFAEHLQEDIKSLKKELSKKDSEQGRKN